jgi:hypothetical protein
MYNHSDLPSRRSTYDDPHCKTRGSRQALAIHIITVRWNYRRQKLSLQADTRPLMAQSMSPRQHHCQHYDSASTLRCDQVISTALSPAWVDIYITSRPSHLGSVIVSMTQQQYHQHDSGAWRVLPWSAIRLKGSLPIRFGGLRSITPTGSPTRIHF